MWHYSVCAGVGSSAAADVYTSQVVVGLSDDGGVGGARACGVCVRVCACTCVPVRYVVHWASAGHWENCCPLPS